jgi:Immunity protein 44
MNYWVTFDYWWDSKIDTHFEFFEPKIAEFLKLKTYSEEVDKLKNIVLCNDAEKYGFKRRAKFSRKNRYIYFDVYIDYDTYMSKDDLGKKEMIIECFLNDIDLLSKFKPKGFNLIEFKEDFRVFFKSLSLQ